MKYDQQFMATWQLPLQLIPVLDWTNASLSYNATYNWDRGATVSEDIEMGNTIKNQRQFDLQANLNLLSLYNKNKYLKKINQKFNNTRTTAKKNGEEKKAEIGKENCLESGQRYGCRAWYVYEKGANHGQKNGRACLQSQVQADQLRTS